MSTDVFPALRGLAFDIKKRPNFSNKVAEHISGKETATSYYENPKWEFMLTYDYLPDKTAGTTDLKTLLGFFLSRRGRYDTFLFQDPDDYSVSVGWQKDFDGTAVEFNFTRGIGGFYEPVGQINSAIGYTVYLAVNQSTAVPGSGPYTITVTHSATYQEDMGVSIGGTALTPVVGAPASTNQYSVVAGVYTFHSSRAGQTATIRYRYTADPTSYTLSMPNMIIFTTAPPAGSTAYATFQFYYVCRFLEDVSEYNKFADKLWELQELGFRSIPQ